MTGSKEIAGLLVRVQSGEQTAGRVVLALEPASPIESHVRSCGQRADFSLGSGGPGTATQRLEAPASVAEGGCTPMDPLRHRIGFRMYGNLDRRLASGRGTVHVLMITTPGRRTGIPRSSCVRCLETLTGMVVWGSGSGSPRGGGLDREPAPTDEAEVQGRQADSGSEHASSAVPTATCCGATLS